MTAAGDGDDAAGATMEEASVTKVLDGRVAMVTGAGRGLGLEIAKGLAEEGAVVLVNGRNREQLARAVDGIAAAGGTAYAAPFDVTDDEAVTSTIGDAVRVHGRLDVLINNVGIRDRRSLFEFTLEDVRRLVNANLVAPFHIAREAAPRPARRADTLIRRRSCIRRMGTGSL
jgi:gluconate 5-dehydrogenase